MGPCKDHWLPVYRISTKACPKPHTWSDWMLQRTKQVRLALTTSFSLSLSCQLTLWCVSLVIAHISKVVVVFSVRPIYEPLYSTTVCLTVSFTITNTHIWLNRKEGRKRKRGSQQKHREIAYMGLSGRSESSMSHAWMKSTLLGGLYELNFSAHSLAYICISTSWK